MPGIPVSSPDITNLAVLPLFDISGPVPTIIVTNDSTIINASNLTWWFIISSPSGIPLHTGSFAGPDKSASDDWLPGQTWTMLDTWLSPFPYPRIEFNCAVPYIVTVYVQDSLSNVFSLPYYQVICAPTGNTPAMYNFGVASTLIQVQCNTAKVYARDTTNYQYQGIIGTSASNIWTMTFPADATGDVPANVIILNAGYVFIAIGFTGYGYTLNYSTYSLYAFANGCSIKIQYKNNTPFGVWCGVDLCKLTCNMKRFYEETLVRCGQVVDDDAILKMTQISFLMNIALAAVVQPACNIDLHWFVKQIEKLLGYTDGCGCSEAAIGVNGGALTGVACCPPATVAVTMSSPCLAPVGVTLGAYHTSVGLFFGTRLYHITASFLASVGVSYEYRILASPSTIADIAPGTETAIIGSSFDAAPGYFINGLLYDVYMRAICSAVTNSGWVSVGSITAV